LLLEDFRRIIQAYFRGSLSRYFFAQKVTIHSQSARMAAASLLASSHICRFGYGGWTKDTNKHKPL